MNTIRMQEMSSYKLHTEPIGTEYFLIKGLELTINTHCRNKSEDVQTI